MFNVAQGFKDIANKFKNGLPIKNGGTGATDRATAWSNISNGKNSLISIILQDGIGDNLIAADKNTYSVVYYTPQDLNVYYGNSTLSHIYFETEYVTWNNANYDTIGVKLYDTAPEGYYLVTGSTCYVLNTSTSDTAVVQTAIVRKRGDSYSNMTWVTGRYASCTFSQSFSQIVYLKPGDFVFIGLYADLANGDSLYVKGGSTNRFCITKLF